jgi:Tol biopolymer transport system component
MRNRTFRAALVAALVVSCGDAAEPPLVPSGIPVRLAISPTSLALAVGRSERLIATAFDAQDRVVATPVVWVSADAEVATVGMSTGVVTAVAKGTVVVEATVGAVKALATITVVDIHGTLVFTRTTFGSAGVSFDALVWSASEGTTRPVPRDSRFNNIAAPVWSPDGAHLAIEGIKGPISYDWDADAYIYPSDIYVANTADAASPWRAVTSSGSNRSPDWSPDGRRIAYVSGGTINQSDLFAIDAQGGVPVRLTSVPGAYETPRWSPDGSRLAYSATGRVYVINADGTGRIQVPDSPGSWDTSPSWSPDGTQLAWVHTSDRGVNSLTIASVVNLAQPSTVFTAPPATAIGGPVWSPDGRWMAMSMYANSTWEMIAVSIQESARFQLTAPSSLYLDRPSAWKR